MLALIVVVLAGVLVLDVALEVWRETEGVRRARDRERDRAAMRRSIQRHGGAR